MPRRHMIEVTKEAGEIVDRMAKKTGVSKKDIVSRAILSIDGWGSELATLVYGLAPDELLASKLYWDTIREKLERGVRRCEEKYRSGRGGLQD